MALNLIITFLRVYAGALIKQLKSSWIMFKFDSFISNLGQGQKVSRQVKFELNMTKLEPYLYIIF